jgi:hypothetical protein
MRKSLISPTPQRAWLHDDGCLDVNAVATVEVTSEEKDRPIKSALLLPETRGWHAAKRGTQTIRQ